MSIGIVIIEAIVFALLFTAAVFIPTSSKERMNSAGNVHNYPPDIQEEYFRTHERFEVSYKSKKVVLTKSIGVRIFALILVFCAYMAGARNFRQGFWLAFGLMVWIGCYDTFFIDWVLFANMKRFRLEGTEHMDKEYHQKWFHLKGMIFPGLIFGLIPACIVGWLISVICK